MCSDRCKNHYFGQRILEGNSFAMFNVGIAAKSWEFKRYVFRLDSMLRELRVAYASYLCDKHGCFSWENGVSVKR